MIFFCSSWVALLFLQPKDLLYLIFKDYKQITRKFSLPCFSSFRFWSIFFPKNKLTFTVMSWIKFCFVIYRFWVLGSVTVVNSWSWNSQKFWRLSLESLWFCFPRNINFSQIENLKHIFFQILTTIWTLNMISFDEWLKKFFALSKIK